MTIVACDGEVMLADGRGAMRGPDGAVIVESDSHQKIFWLTALRALVGYAGNTEYLNDTLKMLAARRRKLGRPVPLAGVDISVLVWDEAGVFSWFWTEGRLVPMQVPVFIGSGSRAAEEASARGASLLEAVEVACAVMPCCGGTIVTKRLGDHR